jgi:hypothetical protein
MDWYVHSYDTQLRRSWRSGPFASEVHAIEFACCEWKARRRPFLVEGPNGARIEDDALQDRLEQAQQEEI